MKHKQILLSFILAYISFQVKAQQDSTFIRGHLSLDAIGSSNRQVPFWMRTNQYGSIPLEGVSASLIGSAYKDFQETGTAPRKKVDWSAGVQARLNAGKRVEGQLIEAFAKVRYSIFQLQAGRTRDITGLVDSTLSTGAFSISGNALGIPKAELSIPDYWSIPYTKEVIALKGNFALGHLGKVAVNPGRSRVDRQVTTYFHQKSLYGRIGKPHWKLKLYGGFNHNVFFGNEQEISGPRFDLRSWKYLWHVVSGKAYGNRYVPRSKVGNHMGSIDQAISYDFENVQLYAYHQFFYEAGGLFYLNNIADGIWGISIQNKKEIDLHQPLRWNKFLVEYLGSKSQGGELDAKVTPSGDEDYYNNFIYFYGWTHKGENLGNNLLTNETYARKGFPQWGFQHIINNRVKALHVAGDFQCYQWHGIAKLTFSKNFGTYATSPEGITTGSYRHINRPPYFPTLNQFSAYLEGTRPIKNNMAVGFAVGVDNGQLLYNSVGGMLRVIKTW